MGYIQQYFSGLLRERVTLKDGGKMSHYQTTSNPHAAQNHVHTYWDLRHGVERNSWFTLVNRDIHLIVYSWNITNCMKYTWNMIPIWTKYHLHSIKKLKLVIPLCFTHGYCILFSQWWKLCFIYVKRNTGDTKYFAYQYSCWGSQTYWWQHYGPNILCCNTYHNQVANSIRGSGSGQQTNLNTLWKWIKQIAQDASAYIYYSFCI